MRAQPRLAAFVFAAIVVAGIDLTFPRLLLDRRPPDPPPPYELFLREIAGRIPRGASVAILVPDRGWARDYAYRYYRASYVLAGHRVIPLLAPDDHLHLERIADADFIAAWDVELPEHELLWRGHGGTLYRKVSR